MTNPLLRLAQRIDGMESQIRGLSRGPQLAYSSLEDGALLEYDENGNLVTVIGKQFDNTHGAVVVSGPVPPVPNAPLVTGGLSLNIGWDGTFAGEDGKQDITIPAPMDFSRVELHVSKTSGFSADTTDTLVDSIESPRGGTRPAMLESGTWYAVLVARSASGKRSGQSAESSAVVEAPVGSDIDVDELREEFEAADRALTEALAQNNIDQAALKGTVTTLRDTTLPALTTDLAAAKGRLTTAETDLGTAKSGLATAKTDLTALANRVSPVETGLSLIKDTTIPALQLSVDGKTGTLRKTAAPAAGDMTGSVGDRWEHWSNLNAAGKLLATYRRQSTGWLKEIIDPTYIPLLDIGQATYGEMSGGRITAGTLVARHLQVGNIDNFATLAEYGDVWDYDTASEGVSNVSYNQADQRRALRFTGSAGTASIYGRRFIVAAGDELHVEAKLRNDGGAAEVGPLTLGLQYLNALGVEIYVNAYVIEQSATGTRTVTGTSKAPAGAVYAVPLARTGPATGTAAPTKYAYIIDPVIRSKVGGNLIVENSVFAKHVDAESVAGAVGEFVKLTTDQLTAGSANLGTAVAQKIAAGTAAIQKADIGNLTVTGTSQLADAVAQKMSAKIGEFIDLSTDRLVAGTASIGTGVADKFFTDIFATRKLTANQVYIGEGGNLFPTDFMDSGWATSQYITLSETGGKQGGTSLLIGSVAAQHGSYFGALPATRSRAVRVIPGETYKVSVWAKANVAIPVNMAAMYFRLYPNLTSTTPATPTPSKISNTAVGAANAWTEITGKITIPEGTNTILVPGVYVEAGFNNAVRFSDLTINLMVTPSLIVDGLMNGKRIVGASVETNSAASRGVKMTDAGLFGYDSTGKETLRFDGANSILTGATVRTAASGARVQLSSAGLEAWGTDNVRYLTMDETGLTATGEFRAEEAGAMASLGVVTYGGRARPGLTFSKAGTIPVTQWRPSIFGESYTGTGSYGEGSLVFNASEATVNSSGRAEIHLKANGAGGSITTAFGPNNGIGLMWDGQEARLLGRLPNVLTPLQQLRTGFGPEATIAAGSWVEWTVTHAAPPPNGIIRPAVTADYDGTFPLSIGVNSVGRTSFKVRAFNGASTSKWVAGFLWNGTWVVAT